MNWFTWTLVVVGIIVVGATVYGFVRPKRSRMGDDARSRERDHGEGMYRGGSGPDQHLRGGSGGGI